MVSIQTINVGLAPNDKKGDPLRDAMQKVNLNTSALNDAIQGVLDTKGEANGFATLDASKRLPAAQAPIVYSATLPAAAHDLNTYATPGTYYQTSIAGATAGANYPALQPGFLEVVATGTPVVQVYTTRVAGLSSQQFFRTRISTASWSSWKELTDTTGVIAYAGVMAASQDLNNYTQRGMWIVGSSATATGGTNYPIGQSGSLIVYSTGVPGGTAATSCTQVYNAANTGQLFTRSLVSAVWTPWVRQLDTSQLGLPNGPGSLDAVGRQPISQIPAPVLLPPTAHDLDTYDQDGVFGQNATAGAVAGTNYPPEKVAGVLTVQRGGAGNILAHQWYRTYFGNNSTIYYRNKVSTGWGNWIRLAKYDESMTHAFLTTATDANTLTADNTWYSWVTGTVFTSGSNWPAITNVVSGWVDVRWLGSGTVMQTVTVPFSAEKPRIFQRYGSLTTGVWQDWKCIGSMSAVARLPTANCGDIYVDGVGWHKWNGTAYELTSLAATLPATAHDLNSYQTPGQYRQSSTAGATAGTNYPVAIGGLLEVIGTGVAGQTKQVYTVASTANVAAAAGPRQFWRFAINTTWSPWQEVLTSAMGMTHTFLTAATDANTLIADNAWYSWIAAVVQDTNFPPYPTKVGGYIETRYLSSGNIVQVATLNPGGSARAVVFQRQANSNPLVWSAWRLMSPLTTAGQLPTADAGDAQVDGQGTYRWNAARSAYVLAPPTPTHRQGLKTGSASTSSIIVYPGMCASAGGEAMLLLSAANTRTCQTSGAFVHSNTGNALLSGARVANTWYYIFLLRRDSDGAVCVAFDTTFNCANRPSTHSYFRRIGQFITDSNAEVWAYSQYGNQFWLNTSFDLWNNGALIANGAYSPATYTPPNVAHIVKLAGFLTTTTGNGTLLQRFSNGGATSAYQYVLSATSAGNSINWWEAPMAAVADPRVSFLVGPGAVNATVKVLGYIDLFED